MVTRLHGFLAVCSSYINCGRYMRLQSLAYMPNVLASVQTACFILSFYMPRL